MDTGKGTLVTLSDADAALKGDQLEEAKKRLEARYPQHGGWFREGEIIVLKGSTFRVKRIKPTEIVLKLVDRNRVEVE